MPHGVFDTQLAAATATKRPLKSLVAGSVLVALCFSAIGAKVLIDARRAAWDRAGDAAASVVATIQADIQRNVESYDLSLQAVVENLAYPEITAISPEFRQVVLFDRSTAAKQLEAITLVDQKGLVRLDSRTPFPEPEDNSDRDYFAHHKASDADDIHVSSPFLTAGSDIPVVALTRRLSNPDHSFAGVMVGTLRLSYFEKLFRDALLGPNGNITLARTDGTVIMRWPNNGDYVGRNIANAELYRALAAAPSGRYEARSITDGVQRLVVYSKLGNLPLVLAVGQSTADIDAAWRSYALMNGILMALLCAMSITMAFYLTREVRRRNAAEATLATLATTDALTGVANRLQFNLAMEREWRRAARAQQPLALAMIDTDKFKPYNDRHGHQAGDRLLQAIGLAMLQTVRRGTDLAARFGGDEFAILLPGARQNEVEALAERLRARFAEICREQGIPASTLSIGAARLLPAPGQPASELLAAADRELYRAKANGRNRTEVAAGDIAAPALQSAA